MPPERRPLNIPANLPHQDPPEFAAVTGSDDPEVDPPAGVAVRLRPGQGGGLDVTACRLCGDITVSLEDHYRVNHPS